MSLLLLILLTQDRAGEETLKKLEETIVNAKTFSCRFRWSGEVVGEDDGLLLKGGTVLMKGDDKYFIQGESGYCVFNAEGGSIKKPGGQKSSMHRPDRVRSVAAATFVRTGGSLGLIAAQETKNQDGKAMTVLGMPEISGAVREPNNGNIGAVSFKLAIPGKAKPAAITLWYDVRTQLLLKRTVELVEGEEVLRFTEVYKDATIDADIPDVKFRSPE
jgi:hypothetical protein